MHFQWFTCTLLFTALATALKRRSTLQTCPLLAKQYPSPVGLANETLFQTAIESINATLNRGLNVVPYNETTFSLGLFSALSEGLEYQYHHGDAALAASTSGTHDIDADSIYRIGSISKLLTVYVFLLAADGEKYFNTPVLELVPELQQLAEDEWNPETPDFSEITIGDLAGQMAGLARDFGLADVTSDSFDVPVSIANMPAFPQLPADQIPDCGHPSANSSWLTCSQADYLQGVATGSPIFPAAYTPVYSNEAFALIAIALSNITGRSFEAVFNETLRNTSSLSDTYYTVPSDAIGRGAIPGTLLSTGFDGELGVFSPAGGYFSTLNDFASLGTAILNSTLLSKAQTRRWFKPTSFVEEYAQGVGRPWEIFRRKVNGYSVDLYTKAGDVGTYSSFFCLVPTYDIGITLFTAWDPAGSSGGVVRDELPNLLANTILPALDQVAKGQAIINFAGHYSNPQTNSSITISTDSNPALKVSAWVSNSVDIFNDVLGSLAPDLDLRILPNELYQGRKVGFTSYYQSAVAKPADGTWYLQCAGWIDVDELTVGNVPLGQLVFSVGEDGKASSVESRALRQVLVRQG
ncbi:hypothetical protein LTR15_012875 [Elasticomyces elasticus]|nr:hypothetical protein LTR15_012875 [Elasticomyces elasticus]